MAIRSAARSYTREFGLAMVGYVIGILVSRALLGQVDPRLAPLVAVIPVVPAMFGLLAYLRFMRRMDELGRRIQLEALAFSFGGIGFATFTYGFLEENAGFPHLSYIWVFPAMIAMWGIGGAIATYRYR